jgi:hypothetical protein
MATKQAVLSSSVNWANSGLLGSENLTICQDEEEAVVLGVPGEPPASLNYVELKNQAKSCRSSDSNQSKSFREHFQRIKFTGAAAVPSEEQKTNCKKLRKALGIRKK